MGLENNWRLTSLSSTLSTPLSLAVGGLLISEIYLAEFRVLSYSFQPDFASFLVDLANKMKFYKTKLLQIWSFLTVLKPFQTFTGLCQIVSIVIFLRVFWATFQGSIPEKGFPKLFRI